MNINSIKANISEKGRVGEFVYALQTDKKCHWIVFDRRSGEILDLASNLSSACRAANHLYQIEKMKID